MVYGLLIVGVSLLAWKIPWTDEPGRLQSTGSQRVGHNRVTNTFTFHFFLLLLWIPGSRAQAQKLWHTGLVASRYVESCASFLMGGTGLRKTGSCSGGQGHAQ